MLPLRAYLIIALCAAVPLAYGYGRWVGVGVGAERQLARQAAATARLQGDYDAAARKVAALSAEIEGWREASRKLSMEIEDEARADPAASGRVPSADSVRRLTRRWGQDPATP